MRLIVARIGRAHGIRGELTVELRTDVPDRRFVPGAEFAVLPPTGNRPRAADREAPLPATLRLVSARDHNGTLLLVFDGVADRTAAEALKGAFLEAEVPDDAADDAEEDAWFDHQLVGLRVVDPAGVELGEVVAVEHRTAQDLLVVRRPDGVNRLVPFVAAIVPTVDVAGRRLVVDGPAGLIDDLPG